MTRQRRHSGIERKPSVRHWPIGAWRDSRTEGANEIVFLGSTLADPGSVAGGRDVTRSRRSLDSAVLRRDLASACLAR